MIMPVHIKYMYAPEFVRNQDIWLLWRLEPNGDKKPRKVPYYVSGVRRHGVQGSPEDTAALSDFRTARQCAMDGNYDGVGIAMSAAKGFSVVDFDACITNDEMVSEVAECMNSYTEYSPSGTGVHVFVEGDLGDKKDTAKDGKWGIELFNHKGFLTFTGNKVPWCTYNIDTCNLQLTALIEQRFGKDSNKEFVPRYDAPKAEAMAHADIQYYLDALPTDLGYDDWIRVGMAIHYDTCASEEGFELWDTFSATSYKYSNTEFSRAKWESFGNVGGSAPTTIGSLIYLAQKYAQGGLPPPINFEPISDDVSNLVQSEPYFKAVSFSERRKQRQATKWLIDDFLPAAELGVMYGAPGSGKSFVALDMCLTLARGKDWMGMECSKRSNKVLYIVAEGNGGFTDRLDAYCIKEELEDPDIDVSFMSDTPLNLTKGGNADKFVADARFRTDVDLIVVDTFARVTPGINESDSADMGLAIEYCRKIHDAYGAMVLLIHHSGKDAARGLRGHSSMNGAADVVLGITGEGGTGTIAVEKQKDGELKEKIGFKLVKVVTGIAPRSDKDIHLDRPGKTIHSCYVERGEVTPKTVKLKANQQRVFDVLKELNGSWVTVKHVVDLCFEQFPETGMPPANVRSNINRTIKSGIGVFIEQNEAGEIRASHVCEWSE